MSALRVVITTDNRKHELVYDSVDQCMRDSVLERLFDCGEISDCVVLQGDKRIAKLWDMKWSRFVHELELKRAFVDRVRGEP